MIEKILNKKQGQLRKILIIIILILLIPLGVLGAIATENLVDDEQSSENILGNGTNDETAGEEIDLCDGVSCEDSNIECPDGFVASCSNTCDSETGTCSSCTPDCEGHELVDEMNETSDESLPLNETVSPTEPEENVTIPTNETNQTIPELAPSEPENIATNETAPRVAPEEPILEEEPISSPELPELDIQLSHPTKITRGEIIEVSAIITNSGAEAKNVVATWQLPSGFEVVSGNEIENCGNLNTGEFCTLTINIQTSYSTSLGINEIKITTGYENGV